MRKWYGSSIVVLSLLMAGCQQHFYQVTDNQSGKSFYMTTTGLGPARFRGGGTEFNDLITGERVSLSSYRVREIRPQEVPATQPASPLQAPALTPAHAR